MCHHGFGLEDQYHLEAEADAEDERPSFLEAETDVETELLTDGGDE